VKGDLKIYTLGDRTPISNGRPAVEARSPERPLSAEAVIGRDPARLMVKTTTNPVSNPPSKVIGCGLAHARTRGKNLAVVRDGVPPSRQEKIHIGAEQPQKSTPTHARSRFHHFTLTDEEREPPDGRS